VVRRSAGAAALFAALDGIDRLVLLGDVLELRNQPVADALAASEPFFGALGDALEGRELVIVPGNHDHALIARWEARRSGPLALEQRMVPKKASDLAAALASQLGRAARVEFAYPGVWLREDVYATHGHYLDVHTTMPTFERIAIATSGRIALGGPRRWNDVHSAEDYEVLLSPVYAWMQAAAQSGRTGAGPGGGAAIDVWRKLSAPRREGLRGYALLAGFPIAVGALNTAGLGPLRSEISGEELRLAGLRAMSEVVERLRIRARHVVFGHTHRAGVLDGDVAAEWLTPNGVALHNAGSWVYSRTFLASGDSTSPYWPGNALLLDDGAPPQLLRLLADHPAGELSAARSAS
jgi:predicted phosphodiesterase